jgi:hypothetical protein
MGTDAATQGLSAQTIVAGLQEALSVGTQAAVRQAADVNSYAGNTDLQIPLPESLNSMANALNLLGMGGMVDSLKTRMTQAAAQAAGQAAPVFMDAISNMSFEDAGQILNGGSTAATDYFKEKTYETLKAKYAPIVNSQMQLQGVAGVYDQLVSRYNSMPFVTAPKLNLNDYVVDRGLQGLFTLVGQQEKLIRENPAARSSALLKQVFGN